MAARERWQNLLPFTFTPKIIFTSIVFILCFHLKSSTEFNLDPCPESIYPEVLEGYVPSNGTKAGSYTPQTGKVFSLLDCISTCCEEKTCHLALYVTKESESREHSIQKIDTCYHVKCNSSKQCLPKARKSEGITTQMVLVRLVEEEYLSWRSFLSGLSESEPFLGEPLLEASDTRETSYDTKQASDTCEVGASNCGNNEICYQLRKLSRSGVCKCDVGFERNYMKDCVPISHLSKGTFVQTSPLKSSLDGSEDIEPKGQFAEAGQLSSSLEGMIDKTPTSAKSLRRMSVSAVSKVVRLPENKVKLSAYTVPSEKPGEHFNYEWTLVSKPEGEGNTGTMNNQNGATVELSNLSEGLYTFKVSVTAPDALGSALVNVTVLPAKRINQLPIAIITPVSQIVKSPNTGAVLDGSPSTDDDSVVKWHWELQQGPLEYKPHLQDTSTLQLDNLVQPGNYIFKLTVTDSDGATNSTTANITVVTSRDYPPEANAGQDIIVYLPQNNVTLNGSLSTDDHGITSWEWTKSPTDQNKAVDMQNTRTPYLQLSNLEEGMYTFSLKVMDTSNQSSHADVHVFVKQPTNNPPTVNPGPNITISLPQNWVVLNGSKSTDDVRISGWKWEEVSRPPGSNPSVITHNTDAQTNVTDLTKGDYEFRLTVSDETNGTAAGSMFVTVTQNQNAPPKSNGGGDQTVVLPASVITLNGTQSSDDLGIVKWEWTREPNSLAIGRIIGNSNTSPILMLTDVVPGRYVFRLKVSDEQGASSEDTVSVIVKPDPHRYDLVELTLNAEGEQLTKAQEDSLRLKLSLLLKDHSVIHVRQLRQEHFSGRAQVVFYVEDKDEKSVMPGPVVVQRLRQSLDQDIGLLELSVANIQTDICQNSCSGHGVCDKVSRQCMCEAFWMENFVRKYFGDKDSNCDWSILYVIVALFLGIVLFVGSVWGMICLCQRACAPIQSRPRKRYSPLDSAEETSMIPKYAQEPMFTDSDSDSDVVFETQRGKLNGELLNGHHGKSTKNGIKLGRRIKT